MTGIEENFPIFGDWAVSNPSPRTFRSSFFNGDAVSRAFPGLGENGNQGSLNMEFEEQKQVEGKTGLEPVVFNVQKSSAKVALGKRMAARAGFSPFPVNTKRSGTESIISSSSDAHSSYVLLSPGVSPTALLEPPVFLSNFMVKMANYVVVYLSS